MQDKFVDSIKIDDWEIETDTGWKPLSHIHKTIPFKIYKLTLENGLFIECADDHIVFNEHMQEVFVKDISIGDLFQTKHGLSKCSEIINSETEVNMYDVTVSDNNHRFYSNEILSHNTDTTWGYILWYILFNPYKRCAILANKENRAKDTLTRLKKAYEKLPDWLQQGVITWNKKTIELENESSVIIAATTESGVTGDTISLLYLDEFALVPNNIAEGFWASAWPTISSIQDSKVIISSTPRGYNLFWKFWQEAISGIGSFKHFLMKWDDIPWRTREWLEEQEKVLGKVKFSSEILCNFEGSTHTLIDSTYINLQPKSKPILEDEHLRIYEEPVENHSYVSIVDTARGVGEDYSVVVTIDVTQLPYKVVCVYRDNEISPYSFPEVIYELGKRYNNSYLLIELNDAGGEVGNLLFHTYEYEHMFFTEKTKKGITDYLSKKTEIGIRTTNKVKVLGCSLLKTIIENSQIILNDIDIIAELSTFVKKRGSYAADMGYNDDLAMTLVLFSWLTQQKIFENLTNVDNRKALFDSQIIKVNNKLLLFGINSGDLNQVVKEEDDKKVNPSAWMFDPRMQVSAIKEMLKEFRESEYD